MNKIALDVLHLRSIGFLQKKEKLYKYNFEISQVDTVFFSIPVHVPGL